MATGTVTYFDSEGGYGFIETDATDDDEDVFFHMADTDLDEDLAEGEDVEFEVEEGDKGPRAADLTRADD